MANKIAVSFEIGHKAVLKSKKSHDNFTHNWELYVRGIDGKDISSYIDKIVFTLHESFPKPKRTFKDPPYVLKESGYAGFIVLVDIHFKNRQVQHCNYDLVLIHTGPPVYNSEVKRFVFDNPSEEFKQKLLKGGGFYENNDEKLKDADDFNKPKQGNDIRPSKKHKNKADQSKLQSNFHNVFGLPITKNSPSMTSNVSSAKLNVENSTKILSKSNTANVPIASASIKSASSNKSDKHLSATKEKPDRKEKHSKHSSSPHKDKISSSSTSKDNIKKDIGKREERKKEKNHSKERDRSREKNLSKRPLSPSPVPGLKRGPSPLSKKPSISPTRSSSVTSNKELKIKNISSSNNITDDRKSQNSSKKSKKDKKSHEKDKDRNREDRKEKDKLKSTSENQVNKTRDSESSRVSSASSNLQTPIELIKDHKSKDLGSTTKAPTSKKIDDKNFQISTPDSTKSKTEKHHDKNDEKHKHKHKKKDKNKDRESSKDLLKDKKKDKNLKNELDLSNKIKDNITESSTTQKLTQKPTTNLTISQTNISPKPIVNTVPAPIEPLPLSDSDSDSEIPTRSTSTATAEKPIQQSDSSNISYQDVKNPNISADQKERKKDIKIVEKQDEKKRKRKNRDSSVDSEKKSPKQTSQLVEPIVKMPRKSNSSSDLKPTSIESPISNINNDNNNNGSSNNGNNNIDNDNSSNINNNNNDAINNNNNTINNNSENNSNINNNSNSTNNNSNSTNNNVTSNNDNNNDNNNNNNNDNANNNILSYSRSTNAIDYMSELRDLQKKIMTLQDNSELQQVVELIAATGRYEITSKTFDFDLCALDRNTVERLQAFFASTPTTSVS